MLLPGATVVVTGAGGAGCGRAIACRFARDGTRVVAADINEEGARETVRMIESAGGQGAALRTDVRDERGVYGLVAFAEKTFGPLRVLVNNASAVFRPGEPLEHWSETVAVDLLGTMYATRAAIDAMRRAGGGAIVNISSISALWHGRAKSGGTPMYDAAKAGVIRLTAGLASLAESDGIRVNCLAPGWIAVPEVREYWDALTPPQRIERGAPAQLLSVDQVASAVVHLATDESLHGRILVWWSDDAPGLIRWADRGFGELEPLPPF